MEERYIPIAKLIHEVKDDMDRLGVPYDKNVGFNFTYDMKTTLGQYDAMERTIFLNVRYVRSANEKAIKNLICHELIHSAKDCETCSHRGKWKEYAQIMNEQAGYNIQRVLKTNTK